MKIIIAKRSGLQEIAYVNASRINSFLASKNPYDGRIETKIYFDEGKCEVEGDLTQRIAEFMASDDDCGMLDLTGGDVKGKSYWEKEKSYAK